MVFLNSSFDAPLKFIEEAFERSENYKKTRFKERSSFFMCLISGESKLDRAIIKVGFQPDDHSSVLVTDSIEIIEEMEKNGITFKEYATHHKDEKKLYGDMTLVELELIRSDDQ